MKILISIISLYVFLNFDLMGQDTVSRKDLLEALMSKQTVSKVEIKEVYIPAGGKGAYHLHECPVVGYVVSGSVLFQIEGEAQQLIQAGAAFYEPKNAPILHFDNASETEPLVFIAFYLVESEEPLITILNE